MRDSLGAEDTPVASYRDCGVFSSGKSSVINALLGEPVLSTGDVPVTAKLTEVTWGETPAVQLVHADGSIQELAIESLASISDQRHLRSGSELAASVRIQYPAPFLKDVVLIDTPGLNSGYSLHDLTTQEVLSRADVVLWGLTQPSSVRILKVCALRLSLVMLAGRLAC